MKHLLAILFLSAALNAEELPLTWIYDPIEQQDIDVWKLYHTDNLNDPIDWKLFGVYTNNLSTNLIMVDITPGQHFFILTASNYWGESLPSNRARTKFAPNKINTLKIDK